MQILVIGDSCVDSYVYGECKRLCPEAPVPVFIPMYQKDNKGMAGNVHQNILSLGFNCLIKSNNNAVTKVRYVEEDTNHILLRVDSGEEDVKRIDKLEKSFLKKFNAIIISDYNKGFLQEEDIKYICENHDLVFIDTKKIISDFCKEAKFIKINQVEYENSFLNFNNPCLEWAKEKLIITRGRKGCEFKNKIYPVSPVEIRDYSGAGDTFLSGLVCNYLETKDLDKAIEFANQCATIVVQQKGVNTVN
jgi:bifunctional ADP-heptose synthase (sugar kinase/adenylyltransferase)